MRPLDSRSINQFLEFLVGKGLISQEAMTRIWAAHAHTKQPLDIIARELGLLAEGRFSSELADFLDAKSFSDFSSVEDEQLLERVGHAFAAEKAIVPLRLDNATTELVVADPFDFNALNAVAYLFETDLELLISPRNAIEEYLRGKNRETADTATASSDDDQIDNGDVDRLLDVARQAPVIKFVSKIIQKAVDAKVTDIHIEPQADLVQIRFRQDGVLAIVETVGKSLQAGIISRIKILAKLNIAERRLAQDGRLRMAVRGQEVDCRVSVMPSIHGETIVMRILDRSNVRLDLRDLGYDLPAVAKLVEMVNRPNGIVLITGPTGSGKTTTLYSLLHEIDRVNLKIFTIEDPVEYRIAGVTQLQIDPSIGLTFASALRSVLRQDPDIILVGEIRDRETAQIAIQAALTGHLVLSTLHTNSAIGAISRLQDMGIEGYLLEATLRGIVSQRLLRRTCFTCHGSKVTDTVACPSCRGTGFHGRQVTYEILEITDDIRRAIVSSTLQQDLELIARQVGMLPIRDHADRLVRDGVTTKAEIARVVDLSGD
jgi:general secretion pathway protein E